MGRCGHKAQQSQRGLKTPCSSSPPPTPRSPLWPPASTSSQESCALPTPAWPEKEPHPSTPWNLVRRVAKVPPSLEMRGYHVEMQACVLKLPAGKTPCTLRTWLLG